MESATLLLWAIWAMLPAYVPNNVAVLVGGGRPLDGGRTWGGRRLLGDGKTWRGTVAGVAAGVALGLGLDAVRDPASALVGVALPPFPLAGAIGLAAGAMAGDVVASFYKRRRGLERGSAVPVLDQLDFVAGAMAGAAVLAPGWFARTFTLPVIVAVVVVTPLLHVGTNGVAYALGLKAEPW